MLLEDRVFVLNNLKCGLIGFRGRRNRGLRNGDQRYFAKNCVTSDCSQIWPITCLVPAPVDCWRHTPRIRKFWILWRVAGNFCEPVLRIMKVCIDECQPNTTQANYSEGFWRITSKIDAKIEVRKHLESVHVNRSKSAIAELCATCSWNGDDFLPVLPSLHFWPSNSCLFWWILSANSCLLVSNSILFWESRKQSVLVREVNMWSRVDAKGLW